MAIAKSMTICERSVKSVAGIEVVGLGVYGLRATAATNAVEHEADIAKVQA